MVSEEYVKKMRLEIRAIDEMIRNSYQVNFTRPRIGTRKERLSQPFTMQIAGTAIFRDIPRSKVLELKRQNKQKFEPLTTHGVYLGYKALLPKTLVRSLL